MMTILFLLLFLALVAVLWLPLASPLVPTLLWALAIATAAVAVAILIGQRPRAPSARVALALVKRNQAAHQPKYEYALCSMHAQAAVRQRALEHQKP